MVAASRVNHGVVNALHHVHADRQIVRVGVSARHAEATRVARRRYPVFSRGVRLCVACIVDPGGRDVVPRARVSLLVVYGGNLNLHHIAGKICASVAGSGDVSCLPKKKVGRVLANPEAGHALLREEVGVVDSQHAITTARLDAVLESHK